MLYLRTAVTAASVAVRPSTTGVTIHQRGQTYDWLAYLWTKLVLTGFVVGWKRIAFVTTGFGRPSQLYTINRRSGATESSETEERDAALARSLRSLWSVGFFRPQAAYRSKTPVASLTVLIIPTVEDKPFPQRLQSGTECMRGAFIRIMLARLCIMLINPAMLDYVAS
jgi:hypothetical protein